MTLVNAQPRLAPYLSVDDIVAGRRSISISATRNLVLTTWLFFVAASAYINYSSVQAHIFENAFQAAEGFFQQILVKRHWNAGLGGVYATVTEKIRPNRP